MKRYLLAVICFIAFQMSFERCSAQINVELLHQLVEESKSEHEKQSSVRDNQAVSTANEAINKTALAQLKITYRDIQSRFQIVAMALDGTMISLQSIAIINEILGQQGVIMGMGILDPSMAVLAASSEYDMGKRAYRLLDYIIALAMCYDDLTGMKPSDRNLLFKDILTQLRQIAGIAYSLVERMRFHKDHKQELWIRPFSGFINKDKALIDNILRRKNLLNP